MYGCRAGLDWHRLDAARIGDRRPAPFGLPPVVDHRSLQLRGGPVDGVGIATLAGQVERTEVRQIVMLQQLAARIFLLDRAECRWRGEETLDLVLRDDAPECAGIDRKSTRLNSSH